MAVAQWTQDEEAVARRAFDRACQREISLLVSTVKQQCASVQDLSDTWRLHDYLSARRYEYEGKYTFDLESILFLFATNLKDGVLTLEDLEGLSPDKIAKIRSLSRM